MSGSRLENRPARQAWPDETRLKALAMLRAGEGSTAASRATGVPVATVTRWARAEGINLGATVRKAAEGTRTRMAQRRAELEVTLTDRLEDVLHTAAETLAERTRREHEAERLLRQHPDLDWQYPDKGAPVAIPADPETRDAFARIRLVEDTLPTRDLVGKVTRLVHDVNLLRGDATARGDVVIHFGAVPRPEPTVIVDQAAIGARP